MAIKFIAVKCPQCGADLSVEEDQEQIFCSYCGAKVIMTNENEHIYRHIDEAQIKQAEAAMRQAETEREVRLRELEIAERKRKATGRMTGLKIVVTILLLIVGVPITGIGIIATMAFLTESVTDDRIYVFAFIAFGVGISILSCIFYIWRPKK